MKTVSLTEARDRLSSLVRRAESGERILITRNGKPIAELGPHRKSGGINWEAMRRFKEERGSPRSLPRYRTISTILCPKAS